MATRWGIAGAGKISHDFVIALKTLSPSDHIVVAVAARDLSRAQKFAQMHGIPKAYDKYEDLSKDNGIEIVYVGLLNPQHFPISRLMLSQHKHLLCEKPLTMNTKETMELIKYAKEKKLFLMEAVWSRCFPIYDLIKKEISSGNLGEIFHVFVSFGFDLSSVDRLNLKELGGGTILDLGVYGLQFVFLIFDEDPLSIRAGGHLNDHGVDVSTSTTLLFKGGRTATIITHALIDLPNEAHVIGTKGSLKVPNFWCPTQASILGKTVDIPLPKTTEKLNFTNGTGMSYEATEVRDCLRKGLLESPKVSHELSIRLANMEDEMRKQIGVTYPQD